jgi:hypothetical protein
LEEDLLKRIKQKVYEDKVTLFDALANPPFAESVIVRTEEKVGANPFRVMRERSITYFPKWRNRVGV